jgi:Double zinc ribbon
MASCPNCGQRLPKSSRYCPQCGQSVEEGETKVHELPPDETGPVPVTVTHAERRYYGVTPTGFALAVAVAAIVAAIVMFATGRWPIGLILLGVGLLLVLLTVETGVFRDRAGVAADSVATRGRATTRLLALRRELRKLAVLRGRLLFELGDAVYRDDEQATEAARQRLVALDEEWRQKEAEMQTVIAQAHDRLRRRRLEVQPTEMVEIPEEPSAPGEQDPTGPAVIPEPYPPPDEGDPPQPAIIPEPSPAVIPEPGPQGPEGKES